MKRALAFVACVACAHASGTPPAVVLALTPPHVPTLAERRAAVCARSDLVVREGPLVASSSPVVEKGSVRSVSVRDAANHEIDVDAQAIAPLARDAAFDVAQAGEVVRRLWAIGNWDDVAVETSPEGGGVAVVFRVTPRRAIANVFVDRDGGPPSATDDEAVASALGVSPGAPYDPVALVLARKAYANRLSRDGHLDAHVVLSSSFVGVDRRAVDVCARVELGPRVVLDAVVVSGTAYAAVLEPLFATNVHGEVLDDDVFERNLALASAALWDRGLLAHKIQHTIERRGDTLVVRVAVNDGAVYRYSRIDVRGDLALPKNDYMKLVTPKPGDVFDRGAMLAVIETLRALDAAKGHADVEIEPVTSLDEKAHTVAVVLGLKQPKRSP